LLIGAAGISLVLQLMIVLGVHSYDLKFMFKEILWTMSGLRSGVLHQRILTKIENNPKAGMGVISESLCCKAVEVSVESMIGAIIQFGILSSKGLSGNKFIILVGSFALSCLSVVNTIAGMDIRKDR
jgi:hypothetical protein